MFHKSPSNVVGKCANEQSVVSWQLIFFSGAVNKVNCDRLCPVTEMIFNMCVRNLLVF